MEFKLPEDDPTIIDVDYILEGYSLPLPKQVEVMSLNKGLSNETMTSKITEPDNPGRSSYSNYPITYAVIGYGGLGAVGAAAKTVAGAAAGTGKAIAGGAVSAGKLLLGLLLGPGKLSQARQ